MPVQVTELVPRDRAEPEEEWGVGLTDIGTEVLPGLEANVLDDVGRVKCPSNCAARAAEVAPGSDPW